ncbi:uncharacterized protein LOC143921680 [Arctopsyche grandis]|uniref:uncharacterized protein LOC143921680 n=1 Tax=Arctopsyche grandis TaxID=121162 RepID=UPI00406D80CE
MERKVKTALGSGRSLNGARVRRISQLEVVDKMGTWNVRTLNEAGKLQNVLKEMSRLKLQILGVCESRWLGSDKFTQGNYSIFHSGSEDTQHKNGVAVIMEKKNSESVSNFIPISERVMLLQIEAHPINLNIIQVYAPTADTNEEQIEKFYENLKEATTHIKKQEILCILGDFNAKVGNIQTDVTGKFGLGERNERGDRLIAFCQENNLIVTNTWFDLPKRRLYTWKSPQDETSKNLARNINNGMKNVDYNTMTEDTVDDNWYKIKKPLDEPNNARYKDNHRLIRKKIKEAKEKDLEEKCHEIETMEKIHDHFNMHKKIKSVSGVINKNNNKSIYLKNKDGKFASNTAEKCNIWKEYIEENFQTQRTEPEIREGFQTSSLSILQSEVENAIKKAKNKKAPGKDSIPVELLKLLDEEGIRILTKLFNQIYETGKIPQEWLQSTFIPLPKKNKPTGCNDYRLISLMSHTLKILLKIIQERIRRKCENMISDSQFGFRRGLGTREALFCMNVLLQKCRDFKKRIYICFIDFEKAFDRVEHDKLIHALNQTGIDAKDIALLKNLYWNQSAVVKVEDLETLKVEISRGVRQGCVLSPMLFNLYSEMVFNQAVDSRIGVKIGGEIINNIRFADDTAILTESAEDLQSLLIAIDHSCQKWGMSININKTKSMASKDLPRQVYCLRTQSPMSVRTPAYPVFGQ